MSTPSVPDLSPELAKRVATALLTFEPPPGEPSWTVPVDYQPVDNQNGEPAPAMSRV